MTWLASISGFFGWLGAFIRTRTGKIVSLVVIATLGAIGARSAWISEGRKREQADNIEGELEAHDRINKAPTGGDVPRDEHREWLRGKANDWSSH